MQSDAAPNRPPPANRRPEALRKSFLTHTLYTNRLPRPSPIEMARPLLDFHALSAALGLPKRPSQPGAQFLLPRHLMATSIPLDRRVATEGLLVAILPMVPRPMAAFPQVRLKTTATGQHAVDMASFALLNREGCCVRKEEGDFIFHALGDDECAKHRESSPWTGKAHPGL
jgi:hypothetical protein